MTIDPGERHGSLPGHRRACEREPLVDAAHTYFRQSEQLPTFIRLAVARHYGPAEAGGGRCMALARRRPDDPASVTRRRQARAEGEAHDDEPGRRRRRELEPRAPPGGDRRGPRAARPDAVARSPALSPVPRGGRARLAGDDASSATAAARASASRPFCGRFGAAELERHARGGRRRSR